MRGVRLRPSLIRTSELEIISELMANAAGLRIHKPIHLKPVRNDDATWASVRPKHDVPQR